MLSISPEAREPNSNVSVDKEIDMTQENPNILDNETQLENSGIAQKPNRFRSLQEDNELIFARRVHSVNKTPVAQALDIKTDGLERDDLVFGNKKFNIEDFRLKRDNRLKYNL